MADVIKDVPGPETLEAISGNGDKSAEIEAAAIADGKLEKPTDYTGDGPADGRVLVLNFGFFKYGTSDRFQGAAILLSIVLLAVIALFLIGASYTEIPDSRFDKIFNWLGDAFLLVVGVAIGRATSSKPG